MHNRAIAGIMGSQEGPVASVLEQSPGIAEEDEFARVHLRSELTPATAKSRDETI
jgi:hypothetical protein